MQNKQGSLPNGFVSFDQAIKMIQEFDRQHPKFDMDFVVQNFAYIAPAHTFNFPLVTVDQNGRWKQNGKHVYVLLANEYEAATFEHAISEKYREILGRELDTKPVHNYTTAITDAENGGNATGAVRINTDASTSTKSGAEMGGNL